MEEYKGGTSSSDWVACTMRLYPELQDKGQDHPQTQRRERPLSYPWCQTWWSTEMRSTAGAGKEENHSGMIFKESSKTQSIFGHVTVQWMYFSVFLLLLMLIRIWEPPRADAHHTVFHIESMIGSVPPDEGWMLWRYCRDAADRLRRPSLHIRMWSWIGSEQTDCWIWPIYTLWQRHAPVLLPLFNDMIMKFWKRSLRIAVGSDDSQQMLW